MLRGIREDCLVMLSLLGKGDISKEPFDHIVDICLLHSRVSSKTSTLRDRDVFSQAQKSTSGGATRKNNGNLFKNFKMDMMSSISSNLNVMK